MTTPSFHYNPPDRGRARLTTASTFHRADNFIKYSMNVWQCEARCDKRGCVVVTKAHWENRLCKYLGVQYGAWDCGSVAGVCNYEQRYAFVKPAHYVTIALSISLMFPFAFNSIGPCIDLWCKHCAKYSSVSGALLAHGFCTSVTSNRCHCD
jgi:hypothetical protein